MGACPKYTKLYMGASSFSYAPHGRGENYLSTWTLLNFQMGKAQYSINKPFFLVCVGPFVPVPTAKQKYSKYGMVKESVLMNKGIQPETAQTLAHFANFGLSKSSWSSYQTVENHLERCESATGKNMSLPFTLGKTLTFVGWLIEERQVKSKTIEKYLSGLRMVHMTQGVDIPCLREPMVKLILSGKHNWDNMKERLDGKRKRDPITLDIMKFFKKKLISIEWEKEKKILFHAVSTLLWNGSFRVHELLSKESKSFDPSVTLLWKDLVLDKVELQGKIIGVISVFHKSPKTDRIGAGQRIEVFETRNFMCPFKALQKYIAINTFGRKPEEPVFRECTGECLTGRKLNTYLEDISKELTAKGLNIKNHSFRAGVPTMMGSLGYSDSDMMAAGRWRSRAFMAYTKLPRLNRARFAVELAEKLTKL